MGMGNIYSFPSSPLYVLFFPVRITEVVSHAEESGGILPSVGSQLDPG